MNSPERAEHPTDQQIEEVFNAWKEKGKAGIGEVLEKRPQEREERERDTKAPSAGNQ